MCVSLYLNKSHDEFTDLSDFYDFFGNGSWEPECQMIVAIFSRMSFLRLDHLASMWVGTKHSQLLWLSRQSLYYRFDLLHIKTV